MNAPFAPIDMSHTSNKLDHYAAIPNELKLLRQWINWRYELRKNDKGEDIKTKVPYNSVTGTNASVTNSGTWNGFADACGVSDYDGIGFVLTKHDDFVFIDLDNKQNDPTIEAAHKQAIAHFDSYTERSPSGTGYHIIARGVTAKDGIRSGSYEIYSDKRYATFTGECICKAGVIEARQEQIDQLWGYLCSLQWTAGASPTLQLDAATLAYIAVRSREPATESDEAIVERALGDKNGEKYQALWRGEWRGLYPSQSEADMALANRLQHYTKNAEQFLRLFHASGLGKRDKAYRSDYVQRTLLKAFDRTLPPLQIEGEAEGLAILEEKRRARDAAAVGQGVPSRLEAPMQPGSAFPPPMGFAAPVSLPTIDASDFAGRRVPSRQWFVFELIPSRAVTMLAGDGGVGKSLLALQLAVAGLTGAQWLGMNAQRGPILYLSAEDEEDEIHRRLDRIITAQGCSYSDLKGLTFATLAGKDAILGAPNAKGVFEATSLFTKLRAQLAEIRPCLLVIDNLADVFGGDEIKKVQVRQFINMLSGLAI